MTRFKISHCIPSTQFFKKFTKKEIKMKQKQFIKEYKADCRGDLAARIFNYCLELVIKDIIDNNIVFTLPNIFGKDSEIAMKVFEGEDFKILYRKGKFNDVDFITSNFRGYQIFYSFEDNHKKVREKPIYINHRFRDMITKNTNEGKVYV